MGKPVNRKNAAEAQNGTNHMAKFGNGSGNVNPLPPITAAKKESRRVRRTRGALGEALVALMHEKRFEEIRVQDVLDRARVGRATFYSHYRDKDDLMLTDFAEFFTRMSQLTAREKSHRVAPIAEMFSHIVDAQPLFEALVASGHLENAMQLAQESFARGIEKRLMALAREMPALRRRAVSQALAGAMLALMRWWMSHPQRESAQAMDELFHRIVWEGAAEKK